MTEKPACNARLVFVYGTLRRGGANDITRLQPAPAWVGLARVNAVMYHLGHYPGVLLGGRAQVVGEVYQISPALERQLDVIEEVWPQPTGEYVKREVWVEPWPGLALPAREVAVAGWRCLMDEVNPARAVGCPVIADGDWIKSAGRVI